MPTSPPLKWLVPSALRTTTLLVPAEPNSRNASSPLSSPTLNACPPSLCLPCIKSPPVAPAFISNKWGESSLVKPIRTLSAAWTAPNEPVEDDEPRKSPLALISPVTVSSFVGNSLPTPNLIPWLVSIIKALVFVSSTTNLVKLLDIPTSPIATILLSTEALINDSPSEFFTIKSPVIVPVPVRVPSHSPVTFVNPEPSPLNLVASTRPNEPVEVDEPLILETLGKVIKASAPSETVLILSYWVPITPLPVVRTISSKALKYKLFPLFALLLPAARWIPTLSSVNCNLWAAAPNWFRIKIPLSTFSLPNEPVEVDEPLIFWFAAGNSTWPVCSKDISVDILEAMSLSTLKFNWPLLLET